MDGSEGEQAAAARAFATALDAARPATSASRTSASARGRPTSELREAGTATERASGERDSAAARLILQQYLDARRRADSP